MNKNIPWPRPAHLLLGLILLLCVLLLLLQIRQSAAGTVATPPVDTLTTLLQADARLKRTVTIDRTGISLDALLQTLHDDGLTLSCSSSCENWKLQLRLKDRPLSDLMRRLAELLPGTWEPFPDKTGYRLVMDPKAVDRRDEWWRLYLKEREKAKAAQSAAVLAAMRPDAARENAAHEPSAEGSNAEVEAQERTHQGFFQNLPPALQEQLSAQMNDATYYRPRASFGTGDVEGAIVVRMADLPPATQDTLRSHTASMFLKNESEIDFSGAVVSLVNGGISAHASVSFPDGKWTGTLFHLSIDTAPTAGALSIDQRYMMNALKKLGSKAPESWNPLAAYQQSRFWKNDIPPVLDRGSFGRARRADVLRWLGDQGKIEFVADYYSLEAKPMTAGEKRVPIRRPLKDELDMAGALQDMSWKRGADDIYMFRNNRWYRDDLLEVPTSLLKKWQRDYLIFEQKNDPPGRGLPLTAAEVKQRLDWEATFVTNLSRWQISNGLLWAAMEEPVPHSDLPGEVNVTFPFQRAAEHLYGNYNTSCFYAGLSEDQRAAVIEQHLSTTALNETQWKQAVYLSPLLAASIQNGPLLLGLAPYTIITGIGLRFQPDTGPTFGR